MARLIKESRIAANTSLSPATELAAKNKAHTSPTRAPDIAGLATPLSQRRSNSGATSSVSLHYAVVPPVAESPSISLGSRTLPADGRRFTSGGELGDIQESPRSAARSRRKVCGLRWLLPGTRGPTPTPFSAAIMPSLGFTFAGPCSPLSFRTRWNAPQVAQDLTIWDGSTEQIGRGRPESNF